MADNMSSRAQVEFFALVCFMIAVAVGDFVTTAIGMSKGDTEMNPFNRFLFGKIGQPFTAFIEIALAIGIAMVGSMNPTFGWTVAGAVSAVETFNVIRNYLLLRKMK